LVNSENFGTLDKFWNYKKILELWRNLVNSKNFATSENFGTLEKFWRNFETIKKF